MTDFSDYVFTMKKENKSHQIILIVLLIISLIYLMYSVGAAKTAVQSDIPYNEFKALVSQGEVKEVLLKGNSVQAELNRSVKLGSSELRADRVKTNIPEIGDDQLLPLLETNSVVVNVAKQDSGSSPLGALTGLLPLLIFVGIYVWFIRNMQRGAINQNDRISGFLKPKTQIDDAPPKTTFEDVAGQENAKAEVKELLDYIRDPERYSKLGATVPKGVLLVGPPGTGKTLLARALAGEAGVPFCSVSASEFIEMYVGVGAARVRSLFDQAKSKAPSIVFIDELDAVGRVRGTGLGGGNDEREQTLNQILSEMDGFMGHEAVIVLAATNRPDVLDPALLRPGRFDRQVTLELPDMKAREAILKVHTRKTPLDSSVDLQEVAESTAGFSGADLRNLVNEAAMRAARHQKANISREDFDLMRDKVVLGTPRTIAIQPDEKHRLAVHEAGHTAAAFFLPNTDPIHKVSIIPRGRALGATQQLPKNERYLFTEPYLIDRLTVLLAGRSAEKHFLGSVSSGADDDIKQATSLAKAMVARWGMSDELGPINLRESDDHPFLGREIITQRTHSDASAARVDQAVTELLNQAEKRALELLRKQEPRIRKLIRQLEKFESLESDQVTHILNDVKGKAVA
jgi:cell division protease FtsH